MGHLIYTVESLVIVCFHVWIYHLFYYWFLFSIINIEISYAQLFGILILWKDLKTNKNTDFFKAQEQISLNEKFQHQKNLFQYNIILLIAGYIIKQFI